MDLTVRLVGSDRRRSPGAWAASRAGVRIVPAGQRQVLGCHRRYGSRRRHPCCTADSQRRLSLKAHSEELCGECSAEDLGQQWGGRVSRLTDLLAVPSIESPRGRKALQPQDLLGGEGPTLPMKGTGRRAWTRRHGPGRLILGELEQKGPEAAPVSEEIRAVAAFGKVLVVLSLRYGRQQVGKPSTRSRHGDGANAPQRVPGPDRAIVMSGGRPSKVCSVAEGDDNGPSTTLRHSILGHVEHPVRQSVSSLAPVVYRREPLTYERESGSFSLDEPRYVLDQESPREKAIGQGHQALEAYSRTVVTHPEGAGPGPLGGLRERLTGRSSGQQRQLARADAKTARTQVAGGIVHVMKTKLRKSRPIEGERTSRRGIVLDPADRLESRVLESEVEPSNAGERREAAKLSLAWLRALAVAHACTRAARVHDPKFYRSPAPGFRGCRGRT